MARTTHNADTERIPEDELPGRIFRLVFRTASRVRQVMTPFFESHGVSTSQWVILHMLKTRAEAGEPDVRLVDLSRRLVVRQPSLSPVINRLVALGFVERVAPAGDRREHRVRLSVVGRRMLGQMARAHRKRQSEVVGVWSEGEKRQVVGLLGSLLQNLERTESAAPDNASGPGAEQERE